MRAVVLVGGYGTRLRPLTLTRPKQLLPVGNRPMLESVLGHLVEHGIEEVVLSLGYRPDAFRVAYPEDVCAGAKLTFAVEDEPLGTAGAIRFAARSAEIDEPFLVCNGDVLTDLDVGELLRRHEAGEAEATIHLVPVDDPSRFGVVVTDPAGRVEAFVEKPPAGWAPSNLINAGTYVFEPSVLGRIPGGGAVSVEREVFPAIVAAGRLHAHHLPAAWVDAGTPEALLDVNLARLGAGRSPTCGARWPTTPPSSGPWSAPGPRWGRGPGSRAAWCSTAPMSDRPPWSRDP